MFLHKFFLSALFSQMHSDTIKVIFASFSHCTKITFTFLKLPATNRSLQDIISHIFMSILLHQKRRAPSGTRLLMSVSIFIIFFSPDKHLSLGLLHDE